MKAEDEERSKARLRDERWKREVNRAEREHHSHCVFNLGYHIIFCPKYRRKLLQWGIDERLKILLVEKAARMWCRIEKMEVMPDHVHVFIKTPPTLAIDKLVQGLKGYTANVLRHERPWLRNLPCLWSRSYYVGSIGHISEETVRRYIEDQKETANRKSNNKRAGRFHPTAEAVGIPAPIS